MFSKYFIVETADNIPLDVMEVTKEYGMDYLRATMENDIVRSRMVRKSNGKDISFVKWLGEYTNNEYGPHDVEYCMTLIRIEY